MKIKDINVCLRLAEERKRLKLAQNRIADICDVSIKTVGRWEKNVPLPADKLAMLVPHGYDITYILTNVRFELPDAAQSANSPVVTNQQAAQAGLSEEQHMWLKILENITSGDNSRIKEIGLALLGYSQTKGAS